MAETEEQTMRVRDVFTREVKACGPEESLAEAAGALWEFDCGFLPVVDDERRLLGVVTDRDICMAIATRDQRASQLRLREVTPGGAVVCGPDDELAAALERMGRARVRRLPVVDPAGTLLGVLSINDALRRAAGREAEAAVAALRAICERRKDQRRAESPAETTAR